MKANNVFVKIIDIAMYLILLVQMLYVFTENVAHELLGMGFFVCLIIHCIQKRWWFKSLFSGSRAAKSVGRKAFDIITVLLFISIISLMLSSMGVSRTLFPWFDILGYTGLHRYLATAVLSLGAAHGMMHFVMRTQKKKCAIFIMIVAVGASLAIGLALVPYLNRHAKKVEIQLTDAVLGEKAEWRGNNALIVYFTRVGNTDFTEDVDAVSGASLMVADGELVGSNELLAMMLSDITGLKTRAITVTGERYPSDYDDTVSVAGEEKRAAARPDIEPLDISGYDDIILIYPLWWGDIPMPAATFFEQNDWNGKKVYLIASQGSSGFSASTETVRNLAEGANVTEVMSIYCEDIPDARQDLLEWVREHKAE